jgi:hypothetical protein
MSQSKSTTNSVLPDKRVRDYSEITVSEMMEPIHAVFNPFDTVEEAVTQLRQIVMKTFVTYGFVADPSG